MTFEHRLKEREVNVVQLVKVLVIDIFVKLAKRPLACSGVFSTSASAVDTSP